MKLADLITSSEFAHKKKFNFGDKKIVKVALKSLLPEERSVIFLKYWRGLSYTDICRRRRIDWGQVLQLHNSALKKLKIICLTDPEFSFSPHNKNFTKNIMQEIYREAC